MISAGHHTMLNRTVKYPWDYRVEYIDCPNHDAWMYLEFPVADEGDEELESVVIGTSLTSSDRKMFGTPSSFCISIINGTWRPSGFNGWDSAVSLSANPIVRYELGTTSGAKLFNASTGVQLSGHSMWPYYTTRQPGAFYSPTSSSLNDWRDGQMRWHRRPFGRECDNGTWTTQGVIGSENTTFGAHRIYDYYRILNGEQTHHIIPCVMGGVAGFYDEIGQTFYGSLSATAFTPGPQVADDYESYQQGGGRWILHRLLLASFRASERGAAA